MKSQDGLQQVVQTHYGPIRTYQERHHFSEGDLIVYQLAQLCLEEGSAWMLQAYHERYQQRWIFPWATTASLDTWLERRITLLRFLETHRYPAPRVAKTRTGTFLCHSDDGYRIMLTSFIKGVTEEYTTQALTLLGTRLGQLHHLSLTPPGPSWWEPATLAYALREMEDVAPVLPPEHQPLYDQMLETLQRISAASLPPTLIHGDCWPLNGIRSGKHLTLIDWEFAGAGPGILDLGALLLMSQCDLKGDLPEQMDAARIQAVIAGYLRASTLVEEDVSSLCDAIRFAISWRGAMLFARVKRTGWTTQLEAPLARAARGYHLAVPIAHLVTDLMANIPHAT